MDEPLAPPLDRSGLFLLIAPRAAGNRLVNACAASLALSCPVRVLDGGNGFDALAIARLVRRQTHRVEASLGRIRVARAFTCYQVAALLAGLEAGAAPILALDLLATFGDENVLAAERLRLLRQCLAHLKRLAGQAPLLVSVSLPVSAAPASQMDGYLALLMDAADNVWRFEDRTDPSGRQMTLPAWDRV